MEIVNHSLDGVNPDPDEPKQFELKRFTRGEDTIEYWTFYYRNGIEKSKIKYINSFLEEIYFVQDTIGNALDFGSYKKGSGYVKVYGWNGNLIEEGNYKNRLREGWWIINYYPDGKDSIFLKNGIREEQYFRDDFYF